MIASWFCVVYIIRTLLPSYCSTATGFFYCFIILIVKHARMSTAGPKFDCNHNNTIPLLQHHINNNNNNNNNNNKFNFYVVQFSGLAQTASHKKKKELIDKDIIIVQACI